VPISEPRYRREPRPGGASVATPVHSRLTVLSRPSGAGKSTVVADTPRDLSRHLDFREHTRPDVCQQLIALTQQCVLGAVRLSGRQNVAGTQVGVADGIINPPIDELLEVVDSKYRLVIMAAKRARQINAYYSQLGEGLLEYVGPLVETRSQEKPLSISLREIKERLLNVEATEG
jgi:DNA-directed RNA polymerase subunit omega